MGLRFIAHNGEIGYVGGTTFFQDKDSMPRSLPLIVLFIAAVTLPANAASEEHGSVKRHPARHWHGYGFLPGYRTPEQIAREDEWLFWRRHPNYYWYGGPRFHRGRWNGGGFGPCWTPTPIGPGWNCGK